MRSFSLALILATGCLGTTPEQAAEDALGPEAPGVEEGPLHRPGQPCLVCHSEANDEGDVIFVTAGTVYLTPDSALGLGGAEVTITDDLGRAATIPTNEAGNFMLAHEEEVEEEEEYEGRVSVPWAPVFPLRVSVRFGDVVAEMRSSVGREGSCAHCHTLEEGAASNGRVYVMEAAP